MANLRVDKITSTETFETTGSVQFDGTGDYLTISSNADLNPESGDFTLEMWVYPESYNPSNVSSGYNTLYVNAATNGLWIGTYQGSFIVRKYGVANVLTYSPTPTVNEWTHVAITRKGSSLRLFYDGVLQASVTDSTAFVTAATNIGYDGSSVYWHGYISNLRFCKGKALYTENFNPPMRELEVTPETVLLACQSKTNTILEKTGKTITAGGNAVASELTPGILTPVPKAGGSSAIKGSVEFDGSGSTVGGYLEVTPDDDLQFLHKCTDSYTIEAWVHKQASTQGTIFDNGGTSSTTIGIVLFGDSGGVLKFRARQALSSGGFHSITTGDVMANDMWHHVALTYDKSTVKLFVNGILAGSTSYNTESSVDSTQSFKIGAYEYGGTTKDGYFNGFISNLRVVKGTALYTEEFIPPTRELKRVPGTVLLCCQDPDNPLTEATGKTITGFGDLSRVNGTTELVTNGGFDSDTSSWTAGNGATISSVSGGISGNCLNVASDGVSNGYARQNITTLTGQWYALSFYHKHVDGAAGYYNLGTSNGGDQIRYSGPLPTQTDSWVQYYYVFQAQSTETRIQFYSRPNGNVRYDSISLVTAAAPGRTGASNFTPQVGDDRKVTFEGVTKINSDAYFYLPTGDTASREATGTYNAGTRGLFGGGYSPTLLNTIEYITIASTGDALDFGDLTTKRIFHSSACASSTRGIWSGGRQVPHPSYDIIDYITIPSKGHALDFGNLSDAYYDKAACSSSIRGVLAGGSPPPNYINIIEYITIASKGDAQDFGDLTVKKSISGGCASPTRGIFAGGNPSPSAGINSIDYVTIATTGHAQDFGDLTEARLALSSSSNSTRGLFFGGSQGGAKNLIDYIIISTQGNAQDFGDISYSNTSYSFSCASSIRGIVAGGNTPVKVKTIEYVNIMSTSNSITFGDLDVVRGYGSSCSNGHGGLG